MDNISFITLVSTKILRINIGFSLIMIIVLYDCGGKKQNIYEPRFHFVERINVV